MTPLNTIIEEETTPDAEWEKGIDEWVDSKNWESVFSPRVREEVRRELKQVFTSLLTSRDTYWKEQLQKAREEERERIEAVFKEHVPPHAMDLEDSVWLKRLLNKAFNHDKNV